MARAPSTYTLDGSVTLGGNEVISIQVEVPFTCGPPINDEAEVTVTGPLRSTLAAALHKAANELEASPATHNHEHQPVQHRDGLAPWCRTCKLDAQGHEPTGPLATKG